MRYDLLKLTMNKLYFEDVPMPFDDIPLSDMPLVDKDKYNYADFSVTGENYKESETYSCENSHIGAKPALLVDTLQYNPATARFKTEGVLVYVCPLCLEPVMLDDENSY